MSFSPEIPNSGHPDVNWPVLSDNSEGYGSVLWLPAAAIMVFSALPLGLLSSSGQGLVFSEFWRPVSFPRGPAALHVAALAQQPRVLGVPCSGFGSTLGPHRPGPAAGAAPLARACLFLAKVLSSQSPSGWDGGSHADFVQQHPPQTPAPHCPGQRVTRRTSGFALLPGTFFVHERLRTNRFSHV